MEVVGWHMVTMPDTTSTTEVYHFVLNLRLWQFRPCLFTFFLLIAFLPSLSHSFQCFFIFINIENVVKLQLVHHGITRGRGASAEVKGFNDLIFGNQLCWHVSCVWLILIQYVLGQTAPAHAFKWCHMPWGKVLVSIDCLIFPTTNRLVGFLCENAYNTIPSVLYIYIYIYIHFEGKNSSYHLKTT